MRVLVGCEYSGTVRDAFIAMGHDAVSCDVLPTESHGPHYQGDVLDIIGEGWDLGIFHPPCTYLTVTANKWLKDQPARKSGALVGGARREARKEGIDFFMKLANANIKMICIENPVGCMSTVWRQPDQIIQPFEFGHREPKKTCLWLKGLPKLVPTEIVAPDYHITKSGKRMPRWYAYADKSKGQAARAGIRSKTFEGIARAMAQQWGSTALTIAKVEAQLKLELV